LPTSIINPQVNETLAPYQFDGGVTIGGANIAGGASALAPAVVGLKAWSFPLALAGGSVAALTSAYLYLAQVNLPVNTAFSNIYVNMLGTVAALPSTTASFAGVWYVNTSSTAALVASTAQIGTATGTTAGFKTYPLTAQYTTTSSGTYYVGLVYGSNGPSLSVAAATAITTGATTVAGPVATASQYPFAINGTSVSTLPVSLALTSNQLATAEVFWVGLS